MRLFRPRTVSACLDGFQRAVSDLEAIAERETRLGALKRHQASQLSEQAEAHDKEGDLARRVARRITEFAG